MWASYNSLVWHFFTPGICDAPISYVPLFCALFETDVDALGQAFCFLSNWVLTCLYLVSRCVLEVPGPGGIVGTWTVLSEGGGYLSLQKLNKKTRTLPWHIVVHQPPFFPFKTLVLVLWANVEVSMQIVLITLHVCPIIVCMILYENSFLLLNCLYFILFFIGMEHHYFVFFLSSV